MTMKFKPGERFTTGSLVYTERADAKDKKNVRKLLEKYQNKTYTAQLENIYDSGDVYLLFDDNAAIGWLTASEVMTDQPPNTTLTPHFKETEFKCKCNGKYCNGYAGIANVQTKLRALAVFLEKIRLAAGEKPLIVVSGIRCKQHNKNVGGSSSSKHMQALAADIDIPGLTPKQEQAIAWDVIKQQGYGRMELSNNHTHVDLASSAPVQFKA